MSMSSPHERVRIAVGLQELADASANVDKGLGAAMDEFYKHGEVKADGVHLLLRMPDERARAILEDPVSRKWLERLPDCPGPWTITFEQPVQRVLALGIGRVSAPSFNQRMPLLSKAPVQLLAHLVATSRRGQRVLKCVVCS